MSNAGVDMNSDDGLDYVIIRFSSIYIPSDEKKKSDLVTLVDNVVRQMNSPALGLKRTLIYFGQKSERSLYGTGRTYVYEVESHKELIAAEFSEFFDYRHNYDFYIYLAREIYEDNGTIFRTFTLAHELQHAVQYCLSRCHFLMGRVIFHYSWLNNRDYIKRIPYEFDARRMAKITNIKINTRSAVDKFLDDKIRVGKPEEKEEYQLLKDINVNQEFDLTTEYSRYWDQNKAEIRSQVEKIESRGTRDSNEDDLVSAYRYFLQECPDMNHV
jgi:hypothetical protein